MACRVEVVTLAGNMIELNLEPQSTVADLRQAISLAGPGVPAECQRILRNSALEPLPDAEPIEERQYRLVVSLDAVCKDLETGDPEQRKKGVETLSRLGSKGGLPAISAVASRLQDVNHGVARAAIHALISLAEQGSREDVIAAIRKRMPECPPGIRQALIEVIGSVAQWGDTGLVDVLFQGLQDDEPFVWMAAWEVLAELAESGDNRPAVVQTVIARLAHDDGSVRAAAADALTWVAEAGDRQAVAALVQSSRDYLSFVRTVAVEAIMEMAQCGDPEAIEAVSERLTDDCPMVRGKAAKAMSRLSEDDDDRCIAALAACLGDESREVVKAAFEAIAERADRGEKHAMAVAAEYLKQRGWAVPFMMTGGSGIGCAHWRCESFSMACACHV
uniref:Ubiquitin-like domain-containing protein n=1 Tax=Alexandrium monilatum TaxID=311494 RepID=A0A7S4QEF8_9DINO